MVAKENDKTKRKPTKVRVKGVIVIVKHKNLNKIV